MRLQLLSLGSMLRHFVTAIAVAVLGSHGVACGSGASTIPTSVAGAWNLTQVDGKSPYVAQASDPKIEVTAKPNVTATGTFTASFTLRGTELDGIVVTNSRTDSGTHTLAAGIVTFAYADNSFLSPVRSAETP